MPDEDSGVLVPIQDADAPAPPVPPRRHPGPDLRVPLWWKAGRDEGMVACGRTKGCSRRGTVGQARLVLRIEEDLMVEQRAGERQQSIGEAPQGVAMAVPLAPELGIARTTDRLDLGRDARPVIDGVLQSLVARISSNHEEELATALGYRSHTGQCAQGVIISAPQRLAGLGEQHGRG